MNLELLAVYNTSSLLLKTYGKTHTVDCFFNFFFIILNLNNTHRCVKEMTRDK